MVGGGGGGLLGGAADVEGTFVVVPEVTVGGEVVAASFLGFFTIFLSLFSSASGGSDFLFCPEGSWGAGGSGTKGGGRCLG